MRVLILQFDHDKGPGLVEQPFLDAGCELDVRVDAHAPCDLAGTDALVMLGGMADPDGDAATRAARATTERAIELGLPVLGICLGAEILALAAGGASPRCTPEYGFREVELLPAVADDPVLRGLPERFRVFQAHGFSCAPPAAAVPLARSPVSLQAFRLGDRLWGTQFHFEPTLAMIEDWVASVAVADALRAVGVDPDVLVADARTYVPGWVERTAGIVERFVAASRALSPR